MKAINFLCQDGGTLCVKCVIVEDTQFGPVECPDTKQWALVGAQLEDQDREDIRCDHCGESIFRFPHLSGDVAWSFLSGRLTPHLEGRNIPSA